MSSFLLPVLKEKTGKLVRLLDKDNREERLWREEGWVHKDQLSQYNTDWGWTRGKGVGREGLRVGLADAN